MSDRGYTSDLAITLDDYKKTDISSLLVEVKMKGIEYYQEVLTRHAKANIERGSIKEGKVLWMLSDACSMMLNPESPNQPFKPWFIGGGRRSALPDDFKEEDIKFFTDILTEITDYQLQARIADICWFVGKPRKPSFALKAIDAYLEYRFEDEDRAYNSKAPYKRAIYLCAIHQDIIQDRNQKIHTYLMESAKKYAGNVLIISIISELLLEHGIGDDTDEVYQIILSTSDAGKFEPKRRLLENAREVIRRKNNRDLRLFDVHAKIAEAYIEEAACATGSVFSADLYNKAILEYQKIPRRLRSQYITGDRINELYELIEDSNQHASLEMTQVGSPAINITEIVNASREHVRGREFPDVLLAFANISHTKKVSDYREEAIKNMQEHILTALVPITQYSKDGRITAKSPCADLGNASSPDNDDVIWYHMMQNYHLYISLHVQAMLLPALKVINAEHRISLDMIIGMCSVSATVPRDRILVWAKGIYSGFENDYMVAVHLLSPQIEHYVRVKMKQKGIRTTTTDKNGIETENGLGTLLADKDISKVLDNDTVFELKAIFTDSFGFNLRNDIAHGLVDSNLGHTYSAVYAWWFCYTLVINHINPE